MALTRHFLWQADAPTTAATPARGMEATLVDDTGGDLKAAKKKAKRLRQKAAKQAAREQEQGHQKQAKQQAAREQEQGHPARRLTRKMHPLSTRIPEHTVPNIVVRLYCVDNMREPSPE